jgi:septum formation protein
MPRRLILASASPRRKELLTLLGLPFDINSSHVDEDAILSQAIDLSLARTSKEWASELAFEKAWDIFNQIRFEEIERVERNLILAADTIVALQNDGAQSILGKPKDADGARRMLGLLSGETHVVYTGVCLMECDWSEEDDEWIPMWNTRVVETKVIFREMNREVIDAYIATGEPFDKAGAYGIQGYASAFVDAIYGDYFNVVGLPVSTVARMLENIGIEWWRGGAALAS